jgi:carboxyl-terminal processing protease
LSQVQTTFATGDGLNPQLFEETNMRRSLLRMCTPTLTSFAVAAAICANAIAEDIQFSRFDSDTARLAVQLIRERHLENQPIDDAVSQQLLTNFVELWDPSRLYFLAADIEHFNQSQKLLDDELTNGEIGFAKRVFENFQQRQLELKQLISTFIDTEHDFAVEESIARKADDLPWAASDAELRERWRKRIKSELLAFKLDGQSDNDGRKKLHQRYENARQLLQLTEAVELLEMYLTALTRCLDPHSSYLAPSSKAEFDIAMTLQLQGIGARLRFADGNTTVESVVPGGSAAADGRLTTGDTIVAVRQSDDMLLTDVVGMKLSRVVDLIRGPADTVVRLKIQKATGESVIYDLTRTTVKLEGQEAHGTVIESGRWIDGATTRIGVLSLPSFYRDFQGAADGGQFKSTSRDVQKILALFRDQNVEALIVDLRGNGGGALDESVEVSGLFIPQGPVVQIQSKAGPVSVLSDQDPEMHWRGPLIVVCDRLSASASEILAGAIRDYRRGIIVGDPTAHGKGTVQNVISLSSRISLLRQQDHGVLKLTVAKWYRVNGDGSQIHGIPADIAIPSIRSTLEKGEAALENSKHPPTNNRT